jgi:hypothetical protein
MRNLLTIVFCVFAIASVMGQSAKLEGTVRDAETGEPIAIASVILYQNGVVVTGTETDFDGYYSIIEIDHGVYDVEFVTAGYTLERVSGIPIDLGKVNKLDKTLKLGIELIDVFTCCVCPPVVEQDNTTQGHVFRIEDIRHSPIR